jgi:hypothetical protein
MAQGTNPDQTIPILERLRRCGLTNELFSQLHHRKRDTIDGHINYCKRTSEFKENGTNQKLQRRLQFLLELIDKEYRGNIPIEPSQMKKFVDRALEKYPVR